MPTAPAVGGKVIAVAATGDLQAAIDAANPGDVIELARGATYAGNYLLPNKGTASAWIVIRPASGPALPPEGTRMTPALAAAANLPRIAPSQGSAFTTMGAAPHYRLVGLELTVGGTATVYSLVSLGTDGGGGQTTLASVPHDLVLDRMYIHGNSTNTLRRCVALNSAASAVIDSYLSDCHERGADSQAIMGWNGPGPFKIVNNYLEGAGENVMFGGSDPGIPNLIPSDIEFRHNHVRKPVEWAVVWSIKNLFELKNARRVLIEENVFENNWSAGQDGTAILFKSTNQDGSCTWCGTSHVTFRRNIVRNVQNGFSIAAHPESFPVDPAHSFAVYDNIVSNIDSPPISGTFRGFLLSGNLVDVSITHNTLVTAAPSISVYFAPEFAKLTNVDVMDNVFTAHDSYGLYGDNHAPGADSWSTYVVSGRVVGNVFTGTGGTGTTYPTGNLFPVDNASIGFANLAGADFHLLTLSPYKGKASDGKDPGADVDAVLAATKGVVIP
jgi:hypothetical protein